MPVNFRELRRKIMGIKDDFPGRSTRRYSPGPYHLVEPVYAAKLKSVCAFRILQTQFLDHKNIHGLDICTRFALIAIVAAISNAHPSMPIPTNKMRNPRTSTVLP